MDDAPTLKRFKESLKARFSFVADPEGKIVKLFDVKTPVLSFAQRYTFVIGEGRKVLKVQSSADAIDPSAAIQACPLHGHGPPAAPAPSK